MSRRPERCYSKSSYNAKTDDEIITARTYPQIYLEAPARAQELISKVSEATVTKVTNEFPLYLIKANKAAELRSKFAPPLPPPPPAWDMWMEEWH